MTFGSFGHRFSVSLTASHSNTFSCGLFWSKKLSIVDTVSTSIKRPFLLFVTVIEQSKASVDEEEFVEVVGASCEINVGASVGSVWDTAANVEGETASSTVGKFDGAALIVGLDDAKAVGDTDCMTEGVSEGTEVGLSDGAALVVGCDDPVIVGTSEGRTEGINVGTALGKFDGTALMVGLADAKTDGGNDGSTVGLATGFKVGASVVGLEVSPCVADPVGADVSVVNPLTVVESPIGAAVLPVEPAVEELTGESIGAGPLLAVGPCGTTISVGVSVGAAVGSKLTGCFVGTAVGDPVGATLAG
jgi:hypothetical protein